MKRTSRASIFFAFLVVAVPLAWGLYRSIRNSMPLFTGGAPAAIAPATPAPAPK